MTNVNLFLKRLIGHFWKIFPEKAYRDVILLYHSVGAGPLSTNVEDFRQQMKWLQANAIVLPLDVMLSTKNTGKLRVSITFDDGYASLHNVAEPIITENEFSATVFLTTGMIHDQIEKPSMVNDGHYPQETFLSWQQIKSLTKNGWSFKSHGWRHLDVTQLTKEEIKNNVAQCQQGILEHTGIVSDMFAFTWGKFTSKAIHEIKHADIRYIFSCIHGPVKYPLNSVQAINRIDVRANITLDDFIKIIRGHWDYLGSIQKLRQTVKVGYER